MRTLTVGLVLLAASAAPRTADAFLIVGKTGETTGTSAPRVALMREGKRTVVTIQATYRGPAEAVVLVIPVPKSVAKESVRTVPGELFDRLDQLAGPKIVELWEQDPCELHPDGPGPLGPQPGKDADPGTPENPGAKVDPAAASGAYDVELLPGASAPDPALKWLSDNDYKAPKGAATLLESYFNAGMQILFAKVDGSKLRFEGGAAALPALRFHYDDDAFAAPIELSVLGMDTMGSRDVVAHVLARGSRFEASGSPNLAVPTNLDVKEEARSKPSVFYGALLDRTFEKNAGAVVTEYAWSAATCDGCPKSSRLVPADLALLGADALPSASQGKLHEVMVEMSTDVSTRPDGPDELRASLSQCYQKALATKPGLGGEVVVDVQLGGGGEVTSAKPRGTPDEALSQCATDALKTTKLQKPGASAPVTIKFSPISREAFAEFVLTRLRLRPANTNKPGFALRAGPPIEGGREEGPTGKLEQRVYPAAQSNNFQARYAIRHPWKGPIECDTPDRGVWGGPPNDAPTAPTGTAQAKDPDPKDPKKDPTKKDPKDVKKDPKDAKKDPKDAKKDPKKAPKDAKKDPKTAETASPAEAPKLESFLAGDLPAFTAYTLSFQNKEPAAPASAQAPPAPSSSGTAPAPAADAPPSDGCGGCRASSKGTAHGATALAALAIAALLRRRPRRR